MIQKVKHNKETKEILGEPIRSGYSVKITRNVSVFLQCAKFNVNGPNGGALVNGCCVCLPRELPSIEVLKVTPDDHKFPPYYIVKSKSKESLEQETQMIKK